MRCKIDTQTKASLQRLVYLGVMAAAIPAVAQEGQDESLEPQEAPMEPEAGLTEPAVSDTEEPEPEEQASPESEAAPESHSASSTSAKVDAEVNTELSALAQPQDPDESAGPKPWETFITGYFRAPMAVGISPRRSPDAPDGPARTQLTYGPNRTVDANYYSFAYTRLQEQDWAELFIGARKEHVEAAVGTMGYWLQGTGFRNNDAAWSPSLAYLKLDTDFDLAGLTPNVALTAGAFWPAFGTFEKYDTYTLGRFRQVGEQVKLSVPVSPDLSISLTQGFGSARDGIYNTGVQPPYQAKVGLVLLHYEHLEVDYGDFLKVSLHHNTEWTQDPNLFETPQPGKAFTDARRSRLTVLGGEVSVDVPRAGSVWISPSHIRLEEGWALADAGTEVMHSLSGEGLATNYFGWSGSIPNSTGSGQMFNVGFLYENTLSNVLGKPGGTAPEWTLNLFGLFADLTLDLPEGSVITQEHIGQIKYGADLEYQALDWLGLMLRYDEVNYDIANSGYVFSAISPRITISSHFLSGESIYLQYSRYRYGDNMVLAGTWPWGTPLVAGSNIVQGGTYSGERPDMDVVRLQATVAF